MTELSGMRSGGFVRQSMFGCEQIESSVQAVKVDLSRVLLRVVCAGDVSGAGYS